MRKAQITAFILIAILIFAAFGFVYYLASFGAKERLEKAEQEAATALIDNDVIKAYVTNCLDDATRQGLTLLGRQGGVLYDYQAETSGSSAAPEGTIDVPGIGNITYIETQPRFITDYPNTYPYLAETPYYPCQCPGGYCDYSFENPCFFRAQAGLSMPYFADSRLNPLKEKIKMQLEEFIAGRTYDCMNFTNMPGLEIYEITKNNATAFVIFSDAKTNVELDFEVTVTEAGHEPVIVVLKYFTEQPVRFKKVYDVVDELIRRDSTNFLFNLKDNFSSVLQAKRAGGQMSIVKLHGNLRELEAPRLYNVGGNDLFKITDTDSSLYGMPYEFYVLRQNNIPSLDYIGETDPAKRMYRNNGNVYDYIVPLGQVITINPQAYDVDEDNLTYSYSGWNFNYTDEFKWDHYDAYDCLDFPENCTEHSDDITSSKWIIEDGKRRYATTFEDVGYHKINVSVSDGYFKDMQTVRILVTEPEECRIPSAWNWYEDIPDEFASIEDPYWISVPTSESSVTYYWYDDAEIVDDTNVIYHGLSPRFFLLDVIPSVWWEGYTIGEPPDITKVAGVFNNASILMHRLRYSMSSVGGWVDCGSVLKVQVRECLPHRSDDPIYPFNTGNAFLANHSCCGDDFKITEGNVCYNKIETVCGPPEAMRYPADQALQAVGVTVSGDSCENCVYQRNFTVACDGSRGNICNGTPSDEWTLVDTCEHCETCSSGVCNLIPDCDGGGGDPIT